MGPDLGFEMKPTRKVTWTDTEKCLRDWVEFRCRTEIYRDEEGLPVEKEAQHQQMEWFADCLSIYDQDATW
jgi:hypothetical protein